MNSYLGEQGWVLNSHLGRSFIIVSGVSNFQPKGILVLISTRLHNLWESISQVSASFSNLLKRGNSSHPIEQWHSNSGRYQNQQGNLVKIRRPRVSRLQGVWVSGCFITSSVDSDTHQLFKRP